MNKDTFVFNKVICFTRDQFVFIFIFNFDILIFFSFDLYVFIWYCTFTCNKRPDCIPECLSRCKILVLLVAKFYQDKTRILEYFTSCKMWNMFLKLVKLTIKLCKINYKVNKRHRWRRSGPFIIKFEHIPLLFTVFLLLTLIS